MTDDEIRDDTISKVTSKYKYGEEEFSYIVAGTITEQLGIEDEFVISELVDEWSRQFHLAVSSIIGYARAILHRDDGTTIRTVP